MLSDDHVIDSVGCDNKRPEHCSQIKGTQISLVADLQLALHYTPAFSHYPTGATKL
jgi:hypothetical protein